MPISSQTRTSEGSEVKLKLIADKVTIRGPKVDGSYVISLELGEYQKNNLANLLNELDFNDVVEATITQNEDDTND